MPVKRSPQKLQPTGIGVERKLRQGAKGNPIMIYKTNSLNTVGKTTYIVLKSFIERNGFDPESGKVFNKSIVPLVWRPKLRLPDDLEWSDLDETVVDRNNTVVQVHATEEDEESSYSADESVNPPINVNQSNKEKVNEPSVRAKEPPIAAAAANARSFHDEIEVLSEADEAADRTDAVRTDAARKDAVRMDAGPTYEQSWRRFARMDEQEHEAATMAPAHVDLDDLAIEFKLSHNCHDESVRAWYCCMQWIKFRHAFYARTEPFLTWKDEIPIFDFEWHLYTERKLERELQDLLDFKLQIDKPVDKRTDDEAEDGQGLEDLEDDDEKVRNIPERLLYLNRIILDMQNYNEKAINFADNVADRAKKFRYLPVNPEGFNNLYNAHIAIQNAVKDEIALLSRIIQKRNLHTKSKEIASLTRSESEWSAIKTIDTGILCDKLKNYFYEVGYKVMPKMIKRKLRALNHDVDRDSMSEMSTASQRQEQLPKSPAMANMTMNQRLTDNVRRNKSLYDPQLTSVMNADLKRSTGTIKKRPSFITSVNSTALPSRKKPQRNFASNRRKSTPAERLMNPIPEEEHSDPIPTYDSRMDFFEVARRQRLQESRIGHSSNNVMQDEEDQLDFDCQGYSSAMVHTNTRHFVAGGGGDDPEHHDSDDEGSDRDGRNNRNANRDVNNERRWRYYRSNRGSNRDHNDPNRSAPPGATDRGNSDRGDPNGNRENSGRGNSGRGNSGRGNRDNDRNRDQENPNGNRNRDNRGNDNRGNRGGGPPGDPGDSSGDEGDEESQYDSEASQAPQDITIEYVMDQNRTQMRMMAAMLARNANSDRQGDDDFSSVIEKEEYYRGLRSPWNVQPRLNGKRSDEIKTIQLNLPQHQNFSGKNDGSYFHWRILVIEHIHRSNLPITEKQALLRRACNLDRSMILKAIFDHTVITKSTYKSVIKQLEQQWGGPQRAYNHIRDALYTAPILNLESEESVSIVKQKIDRYREHVQAHRLTDLATGREVLYTILSNLFTERQVSRFRRDCMWLGFKEPNSLEAVSHWLGRELTILQWGSETHSKVLVRQKDKSQHKKITHCVSTEDQIAEVDEGQVLTASSSIPQPESSGTAMVTGAAGGEPPASTRDESSEDEFYDAEGEVEFEFEGNDGDDLCLAALMNYIPPDCVLQCKEKHYLSKCPVFLKLDPKQRSDKIISLKRCLNCLKPDHISRECKSKRNCSKCNKRHNTVLCYAKIKPKER